MRQDRSSQLLRVAHPVLDSLFATVGRSGAAVALADHDGVVLEVRDCDADRSANVRNGVVPGGQWSEALEGTNGIGTCLAEQRAVMIQSEEHFASHNTGMSCMDAPIFDPDGRIAAALNLSSARADCDERMAALLFGLVQDAARAIESEYFCHRFEGARIVLAGAERMGCGPALLAVDRDDLVVGATRGARRKLGLALEESFQPRPLGDLLGQPSVSGFGDGDRAVLRQALARAGGNVSAAARLLKIGRATFYRRMERAGMAGATVRIANS